MKEDAIQTQIEFLNKHPDIALVGGMEDKIDEKGTKIYKKNLVESKIYNSGQVYEFVSQTGSYIPCSSVMFDMEKIRQVGYFDTDTIAVDELYWPKVLQYFAIAVLGKCLIDRRQHSNQSEYGDFIKYYPTALSIYKKFNRIRDYEINSYNKKKISKYLSKKFSQGYINIIAFSLAKNGYKKIAIGYVIYAFRIDPYLLFDIRVIWKALIKTMYYLTFK